MCQATTWGVAGVLPITCTFSTICRFFSSQPAGIRGGWQANGIVTFQQGTPLQTGNNGTAAKKTGSNEARLNSWFDQSVFSQAGNFTFGNTSRTSPDLRGFGTRSVDASLFKRFYFREKANVEFRAEAFNLRITPSRR